jgi:UDP-N-acetylmuramoyl-tripeptide--D-alanyl-D-alanine ligase
MNTLKGLLSLYRPGYLRALIYMLQSTEYQPGAYLAWYWRTTNFRRVMHRRTLQSTKVARLLLLVLRCGVAVELLGALGIIYLGVSHQLPGGVAFGTAALVIYPVLWAHLIVLPLLLGRWLVVKPREARLLRHAQQIFADHPGVKIAVAGSYGKTTMKELLNTVLSKGLKVAATPANKNVSSSHAQFARQLQGDEAVLVIEYGEGAPGDVVRFTRITQPTHAVITGLAPAHLDHYKTLEAAGRDIFSVAGFVKRGQAYVNNEFPASVTAFIKKSYQLFDHQGALGWKTANIKVALKGTDFTLKKGKHSLRLHSGLVGRHQVGYLAFVAALASELGLTDKQIIAGIARTQPFEHRMQPYQLSGAWIIDDTYNGNLEGIRAGTRLLRELKAERKIYVTPGLVDQGLETERVHREVGELIATAHPDLVVLMQNSVSGFIESGLQAGRYKGELRIETDPLEFYTSLGHFVAAGDLVVMQNDWPDNYA